MQVYDLDINEKFDIIKMGEREYKIGDIPVWIFERIQKIKLIFSTDKEFLETWKEIIIDLLKIKNENVEAKFIGNKHILQIIDIISKRIKKQDDYKK